MKLKKHLRPDHQMFDEVKITTHPRFKESELSGSEWRISATLEFLCKGKVMHSRTVNSVKSACMFTAAEYLVGCDKGRDDIEKEYQFEQHRSFCKGHANRGDQSFDDSMSTMRKLVNARQ